MADTNRPESRSGAPEKSKRGALMWLLILPFIGTLFPLFFNYREPSIGGIPFFYWYQLVWIPIAVFLTWLVYRIDE